MIHIYVGLTGLAINDHIMKTAFICINSVKKVSYSCDFGKIVYS